MATAKKAPAKKAAAPSKKAAATAPARSKPAPAAKKAAPAKKAAVAAKKAPPAKKAAPAPVKKAAAPAKKAAPAPVKKAAAPAKKAAPAPVKKAAAPAKKAAPAPVKKAAAPAAPKKAAASAAPPTKKAAPAPVTAPAPTPAPAAKKAAAKKPGPVTIEKAAVRGVTKDGISYTKDFDAKFLTSIRALLLEEKASLLGQAVRLEDEALSLIEESEMGDVQFDDEGGEGDTMVVERERDLALSAQARQTIADIEAALERLVIGTYGYSVESGRPIPRERLEAIPWATVLVEEKVGGIGRR
ncbi:MAG: hypothetical protein Q8M22_06980 [Actinomycetota bacterium]|nr:hypothetical protein [Actinomycetota bacterium]